MQVGQIGLDWCRKVQICADWYRLEQEEVDLVYLGTDWCRWLRDGVVWCRPVQIFCRLV